MFYQFQSSQTDRSDFDEMLERYIEACFNSTPDLSIESFDAIADDIFDNMNIVEAAEAPDEADASVTYVDDAEEARGRFDAMWTKTIRRLMVDRLTDELYREERGTTGCITVFNSGQQNGLHYDSTDVEYVLLDGDRGQVCYRYTDGNQDYDWEIGSVEDAIEEAFTWYEETRAAQKDAEEQAEIEAEYYEGIALEEIEEYQRQNS